jgi:hypothetical protein
MTHWKTWTKVKCKFALKRLLWSVKSRDLCNEMRFINTSLTNFLIKFYPPIKSGNDGMGWRWLQCYSWQDYWNWSWTAEKERYLQFIYFQLCVTPICSSSAYSSHCVRCIGYNSHPRRLSLLCSALLVLLLDTTTTAPCRSIQSIPVPSIQLIPYQMVNPVSQSMGECRRACSSAIISRPWSPSRHVI